MHKLIRPHLHNVQITFGLVLPEEFLGGLIEDVVSARWFIRLCRQPLVFILGLYFEVGIEFISKGCVEVLEFAASQFLRRPICILPLNVLDLIYQRNIGSLGSSIHRLIQHLKV